jgi:hypothetical protein
MCNTRLKIAIIKNGLKAYELAHELGWHPTKLSHVVTGAYPASVDDKRQIADALGKTVSELFNSEEVVHA